MTFSKWLPKLATQVGVQKPLTCLSRLKFDLKSCGISQIVAFLLRDCIMLIFFKIKNRLNNISRWPPKLITQDGCERPLNRPILLKFYLKISGIRLKCCTSV